MRGHFHGEPEEAVAAAAEEQEIEPCKASVAQETLVSLRASEEPRLLAEGGDMSEPAPCACRPQCLSGLQEYQVSLALVKQGGRGCMFGCSKPKADRFSFLVQALRRVGMMMGGTWGVLCCVVLCCVVLCCVLLWGCVVRIHPSHMYREGLSV